jgi:SAM-dependent methyltransferase
MADESQEIERIQRVYAAYAAEGLGKSKWSFNNRGNVAIIQERTAVLLAILEAAGYLPLAGKHILEVGCGGGRVLKELISLGADASRLCGVDLLPDRIESGKCDLPDVSLRVADARHLPFGNDSFDLVMVFTVFSSILDVGAACQVAGEISRVLKPGGAVVSYDFQYNNPRNPNVRGIKRTEIQAYFPGFSVFGKRLTLLPPLARRLGLLTRFAYPLLAVIPLLRTHFMAALVKPM